MQKSRFNNVDVAAQGADTAVSGDDVQDQSIPSPTPPNLPPQQPQDLPSTSQEALDACAALTRLVKHLEHDIVAQALEITKIKKRVKKLERANKVKILKLKILKKVGTSQRIESSADTDMEDASNQERMIAYLDRDTGVALMDDEGTKKKAEDAQVDGDEQVKGRKAKIYQINMDHASKGLSMQEDEPEVQEEVDVVTTTKLITKVVAAISELVTATSATIAVVHAATITAALVRVVAASTRRRKGVVIRDPEKESTTKIPAETKSKVKGIMVEEPKPMKKKQQVEIDEDKEAKEDSYVQRYQVMKKRPQTEAQARRNMIMYLKNVAGFRLDYFKGMSYDDIRPIFEAKFNSNIEFLLKSKEQIVEEENRAIESINETLAQKAAKKRKLNEEVPVVDYHIIQLNNKPLYKIIRADGTHQLYVSFITLLKNFDREDLESLWSIVKERFSTSKLNNFSDDYLLTTLRAMFERPDGQDRVWKSQRSVHGQANVKSWKLLESCGQICDNKCRVTFSEYDSEITKDGKVIGRCIRKKGLYVMKVGNKPKDQVFLAMIDENFTLWHMRLGHANMCHIQSLASKELVRNPPNLKFDQHFCDACKMVKQAHASHKAKNIVSTTRCLELIHMNLFGPFAVQSYRGNRYTLVIVDDYSRYTWTRFLKDKTKAFDQFKIFSKKIQNKLRCTIVSIRTDHSREFDNEVQFREFCNANGITHNFSAPCTPQSNDVVERKNKTLQEISRTMLNEQSLPQKFWCNVVDTSTYILNRILIRVILGKTPYELLRGRKPTLDYFRVFGSKCFILNTKDYLTKFDPKSYEESINVTFDETPPPSKTSPLLDDDLDEEEAIKVTEKKNLENDIVDETLKIDKIVNIKESRNHQLENVIGNLNQRTLRLQA
nr:retrovirus-related Pol polyprotein from transposon TNT 1-94 [Tanacetum cinerariifolium]